MTPRKDVVSRVTGHAITLVVGHERFVFDVQHKVEDLGGVAVRQLWLAKRTLYDPRRRGARNARSVVDAFWALARARGDGDDPGARESYLLAKLLPDSCTKAARTVMPDGGFGPDYLAVHRSAEVAALHDLERMLSSSAGGRTGLVEFARLTADLLGVPHLDAAETETYDRLAASLLDDAKARLPGDPRRAVRLMTARWAEFKRRWARRRDRDFPAEKRVLAVLSYECRAAFNYCYAEVWERLLAADGPLRARFDLGPADLAFLRLWHSHHAWDANERADARFYLFHGHVFGLHPALSLLIRTRRGREILGAYAAAAPQPDDEAAWGPVLFAATLSVNTYMQTMADVAESRRALPTIAPGDVAERASSGRL